ncbi:MAG: DNA gyrase inhibitor YacG [Methylocella sp.]
MHLNNSEDGAASPPSEKSARSCPICGKPSIAATRPFCSKRCADVDLHRWLAGVYAIPVAPDPDDELDSIDRREDENEA